MKKECEKVACGQLWMRVSSSSFHCPFKGGNPQHWARLSSVCLAFAAAERTEACRGADYAVRPQDLVALRLRHSDGMAYLAFVQSGVCSRRCGRHPRHAMPRTSVGRADTDERGKTEMRRAPRYPGKGVLVASAERASRREDVLTVGGGGG